MAALHFDGIYSNKMGRVAVLHHHLTRSAVAQSHVLPINSDLRRYWVSLTLQAWFRERYFLHIDLNEASHSGFVILMF